MRRLILMLIALCALVTAHAQEVNLDKTVRAGELQLFQDYKDPLEYYYVPNKARLAMHAEGLPQFSFLRYVRNAAGAAGQDAAREGEGGGIAHALVELSVPPEMLDDARKELQRTVPGAKIMGPIIYRSGRVGLVSSFKQENGELTTKVLGLGSAPILEGDKAAVSIQLTKQGATLLWNSFQTATPDISFNFEMEFAGYRQPYEATVEADWEQVYSHRLFSAALVTSYGGAEIKDALDDLVRSGAIKVTIKGSDEKLDQLVGAAQAKLVEAMFDRIDQSGQPSLSANQSEGVGLESATRYLREQREESRTQNAEADRQANAIAQREAAQRAAAAQPAPSSNASGSAPSLASAPAPGQPRPRAEAAATARQDPAPSQGQSRAQQPSYSGPPSFALLASYSMKKTRNRGHFRFDFSRATLDMVHPVFAHNIGSLSQWTKNDKVFRAVNLDDDLYKQREIVVMLDGQNAADFSKYINFVTVQMRKKHGSGETSTSEVRIDRTNFNQTGGVFRLAPYGWKGDTDRSKWLDYEYRTTWSFFGGKQVETEFVPATSMALGITPPFARRVVEVDADPSILGPLGVRLVTVNLYHEINGEPRKQRVTLKPAGETTLAVPIEFIHAPGDDRYRYDVTWQLRDTTQRTSGMREGTADVIFADELQP